MTVTTPYRIEMFGGLKIVYGNRSIARFSTHKTGSLLAYLAFRLGERHPREVLVEMFWPEGDPTAGRHSLNTAVSSLRRQLEAPGSTSGSILCGDRHHVWLERAAITTDVLEFDAALRLVTPSEVEAAVALQRAVELFRSGFLPGFYDDWAVDEQRRLAEQFHAAACRLIDLCLESGCVDRALDLGHRLLKIDPLDEQAHLALMRILASSGDTSGALRHYERMSKVLAEELGCEPPPAARELAEAIRATKASNGKELIRKPPASRGIAVSAPIAGPTRPMVRLPVTLSSFFGREEEMQRLDHLLRAARTGRARLITLTGPGGSGKTRLALEAAERAALDYDGAVWFAGLADLSDPALIPRSVADALGLPPSPSADPLDQVAAFLGSLASPSVPSRSLLLLDNLEHLLSGENEGTADGAAIVLRLLQRVPHLTCLVTSRQRLNVEGERELQVPPLPAPSPGGKEAPSAEGISLTSLLAFPSVQMFVDRAQGARPDFQITSGNARVIAEICARLEGIPLAIELAAARANVLTPAQILAQLEHPFELLVTRRRDASDRHRTLHAALDWSFRLLSPRLQQFFRRLSVFRGGWTVEAAREVCDEPVADALLEQLRESSLILADEMEQGMRFRMLETLREYSERLPAAPDEVICVRQRHLEYYLCLAERAEACLQGREQAAWLGRLELEHDNLREALSLGIGNRALCSLAVRLCAALSEFWRVRCHFAEGRQWCRQAVERVSDECSPQDQARAILGMARMAHGQGEYADARRLAEDAVAIYRRTDDRAGEAHCLDLLGSVAGATADYEKARSLFEAALTISRDRDDRASVASSLTNLGLTVWWAGHTTLARQLYEEALAINREIGNQVAEAGTLRQLGILAEREGDHGRARRFYEQSLAINREVGYRAGEADVLRNLANVVIDEADLALARSLYEQALAIHREIGDQAAEARDLVGLSLVARSSGNYDVRRSLVEQAISINRAIGERAQEAENLGHLGSVLLEQGIYPDARRAFNEELSICRQIGYRSGEADSLHYLGYLAELEADDKLARELYSQALLVHRALGKRKEEALCLTQLGATLRRLGELPDARRTLHESLLILNEVHETQSLMMALEATAELTAEAPDQSLRLQLHGACDALRQRAGISRDAEETAVFARIIGAIRTSVGEEEFVRLWELGRGTSTDHAVSLALAATGDVSD